MNVDIPELRQRPYRMLVNVERLRMAADIILIANSGEQEERLADVKDLLADVLADIEKHEALVAERKRLGLGRYGRLETHEADSASSPE